MNTTWAAMNPSPVLEWGVFFGRILVGLTLLVAGLLKMRAGSDWFLRTLLAYDLVKGKAAVFLSKGLPWIETACGALLVPGFLTPLAAIAGFIILLIFTSAVTSAILRDKPIDCGCFGRSTKVSRARWTLVYRNIVLMGLLLPVQVLGGGRLSLDAWLMVWPYDTGRDVQAQVWLVIAWVMLMAIVAGLHLLTRRRAAGARSEGMVAQARPET